MIEVEVEQGLAGQFSASSGKDVVVLFYSSWCPFCRSFKPVFEKYAENPSSFVFIKVRIDEDENPMWETYSLDAVPSVLLFRNGQAAKRLDCERGVGLNEAKFSKWLKSL